MDPLAFPDWDDLISKAENGSFFHTSAWARVLCDTYGHQPCYLATGSDSTLQALLPIMDVSSRVTGKRGVCLPFTDACPIIVADESSNEKLFGLALEEGRSRSWRYLEIRSNDFSLPGATASLRFFGHILELRGNDTGNFERLDSVMRRGIRKANNSGLQVEFATSREAIGEFYELHCQTRRRHGVPPQPFRFFENIARHVLGRDLGFVAIARLAGRPVAAAVYFYLQREAIYKFGASDYNQQHWRPNNLLMWEAIKRCVKQGCTRIHLGRTSLGQEGLRRFKLSLGAREEQIAYYRYDFKTQAFVTTVDRAHSRLTNVFRYFPQTLFRAAGRWLYPHLS